MIREQHMAGVGAIASERAAAVFGLETLRAGVQDHDDNTTRFLIVTRATAVPDFLAGRAVNKTTIVFTLPNTPGALFKALSVFALRDIDVTKIESRPTGRPWEYLFHMDLAVGQHELRCGRALSHLAEFAPSLKVLGSYPGVDRSAAPVAQDARVAGGVS
jgi:prephenate dehydratase